MSWVGGCLFLSLTAVVAYDLVDLYDDVFGDAGLYGSAIDHLGEVDALLVWLSDRYLTEYFILAGNYDADEITRNVRFPCGEFLQCDEIDSKTLFQQKNYQFPW